MKKANNTMAKYKVTLSIGFHGAKHEDIIDIPDDDLEACKSEEEKDQLLDGYWNDWAANYIDGGIRPVNEN